MVDLRFNEIDSFIYKTVLQIVRDIFDVFYNLFFKRK